MTVRIVRLAAGGDGVGRLPDGRTVFVPRTAPGDLVALRAVRRARRFARARVAAVLEPGPGRVEPRCPHYTTDECGGCQLQHLAGDVQREARRGFVGDALRRLARLEVADPPLEPAEREFGYRTKLTLHAAAGARRIGLRPYGRPDAVFELVWCHITDAGLMELWQAVRELRHWLPRDLERLVLRRGREGEAHVIAAVRGAEAWTRAAALARELEARGQRAALWWKPEGGVARALGRATESPPHPGVFEQVNPPMGARARAYAVAALGPVAGRRIWDLYAGIGETTALLAREGAVVESVELDRRAVAIAEGHGPPARRHAGAAEDVVPALGPAELVVTNPPRGGMDSTVVEAIAAARPRRIAYVSCDPATLARDVGRLGPAYRMADLRAFDLFPQTAHVETVAVLERT
ncbi:MAG TPA: TRAM domain-containing protein [Gemmatimonadales bacterium]|nr:TRAM domain-containing protein [Gemmatimonadales bacterium]